MTGAAFYGWALPRSRPPNGLLASGRRHSVGTEPRGTLSAIELMARWSRRLRAQGIRDRPISPRSPWQNAYAERLIGSVRRECVDHVVVFGERHLRHLLLAYKNYVTHTHLSLNKDAPPPRAVQPTRHPISLPILGGAPSPILPDMICDRDNQIVQSNLGFYKIRNHMCLPQNKIRVRISGSEAARYR
jgi:hypothetical protein